MLPAAAIVVAGAWALAGWRSSDAPAVTSQVQTLAVLPFQDAAAASTVDDEFLADGLTEELINRLSAVDELRLIARASSFLFRDRQEDLQAIAKQLGADAVVTGRLRRLGDELLVNVELTANGVQLWGERFRRPADDLYALQTEVATVIAERLRIRLSPAERSRLAYRGTDDPEAHQLYLKGLYHWNRAALNDVSLAVDYFRGAVARDPNFALAHAGLASALGIPFGDTLSGEQALTVGRAEALRAIDLDPSVTQAYVALASIDFWFGWSPRAAEARLHQALDLDPKFAVAHHQLGWLLALTGRFEESRRAFDRALELDPLSLVVLTDTNLPVTLGNLASGKGAWLDDALRPALEARRLDPNFFLSYFVEGWIRLQIGDLTAAAAALERSLTLEKAPMVEAWLGHVRARLGDVRGARELLTSIEGGSGAGDWPWLAATIHVGLGETDEAFAALERALAVRDAWMVWLTVDPVFAPLYKDPRWRPLVERFEDAALDGAGRGAWPGIKP